MSPVHPVFRIRGPQRLRTIAIWVALSGLVGGIAFMALGRGQSQRRDDLTDVVVLGAWAMIALAFAWMRFRPRRAYDDAARPRAEAFQLKRANLLIVCAGYVGLLLTPLSIYETLFCLAHATAVERLFDAALFLAPCAMVVGLVTTGLYSRQWGVLVDDELTLSHRAASLAAGFWVFAALGAAAFVTVLFRPDWAIAALPAVAGPAIAAAGLRFALLERVAAQADG